MKHNTVTWQILLPLMALGCPADPATLPTEWSLEPIYGLPNLDGDQGNGRDWNKSSRSEDENDLSPWSLHEGLLEALDVGQTLELTLEGDTANIRLWSGATQLLNAEQTAVTLQGNAPTDLAFEFGDFLAAGTLTIEQFTPDGESLQAESMTLMAAPMILNHHLQPVERAYAVEDGQFNQQMIDTISDIMGNSFVTANATRYDYDVWVQDEFETSTLTSPTGRIDLVIDSIRTQDGGLDDFPEDVVTDTPDAFTRTWGNGMPSSQDSFGNLEVSPPVTVNGIDYPFGRVYWGKWNGAGLTNKLADALEAQKVQDPFNLDVTWLCVGHVDEFTTFLPDPDAPKGFRLYVGDAGEGLTFLDGLDPSLEIPRYATGHNVSTVGELQDDAALRALNEDYQSDWIDPQIEVMKKRLGLTEDDIVRIPAMYEEHPACGPYALALFPGTVNMLVITQDDGSVDAVMPDPFLRGDGDDTTADPLIAAVEALLPQGVRPHWVDDWRTYHLMWGEVHCGTNTTRTPNASWWLDAMHLIEEE